jgi:hypothetical protein
MSYVVGKNLCHRNMDYEICVLYEYQLFLQTLCNLTVILSIQQLEWCSGEVIQDVTSMIIILLLLDSVPTARNEVQRKFCNKRAYTQREQKQKDWEKQRDMNLSWEIKRGRE